MLVVRDDSVLTGDISPNRWLAGFIAEDGSRVCIAENLSPGGSYGWVGIGDEFGVFHARPRFDGETDEDVIVNLIEEAGFVIREN